MTNSLARTIRLSVTLLSFVVATTATSAAQADEPVPPDAAGAKVIARPVETAKKAGTPNQAPMVAVLRFFGWTT